MRVRAGSRDSRRAHTVEKDSRRAHTVKNARTSLWYVSKVHSAAHGSLRDLSWSGRGACQGTITTRGDKRSKARQEEEERAQ